MTTFDVGDTVKVKKDFLYPDESPEQKYLIVEKRDEGVLKCVDIGGRSVFPSDEFLLEDWCELVEKNFLCLK